MGKSPSPTKFPEARLWSLLFCWVLGLLVLWVTAARPVHGAVVSVKAVSFPEFVSPGKTCSGRLEFQVAKGWHIHGPQAGDLIPTRLLLTPPPGMEVVSTRFSRTHKIRFPYAREALEVFSDRFTVDLEILVQSSMAPGAYELEGKLTYQGCSEIACLPPETTPVRIHITVLAQPPRAQEGGGRTGWDLGFWVSLLGVFLGGLALNLTPCVYPLIPITVSYFGGRGRSLKGRALMHGALYLVGLSVTNSLLGLSAALSGGLLGGALQQPLVLLGVAAVLVILALSFFGLWELRVPLLLNRLLGRSYSGYGGTLFMGLTLGVVAAPCLGPFILGLLTYVGQKGDPFLGFLYFFVLSVGLGLPLGVLAVFSKALDRLPLSGEWMLWVRKGLGWVLVGMAWYQLRPLIPSAHLEAGLLGLVMLAAGLHLGWVERSGRLIRGFSVIRKGVGLALVVAGLLLGVRPFLQPEGIRWTPYSEEMLRQAAQEGKPVVLDFFAEWCGPCKAMDRTTFQDPEAVHLSRRAIMLRADLTAFRAEQEALRRRYAIRGVPTILFFDARGEERKDLRAESYLDRNEFVKRLTRLLAEP